MPYFGLGQRLIQILPVEKAPGKPPNPYCPPCPPCPVPPTTKPTPQPEPQPAPVDFVHQYQIRGFGESPFRGETGLIVSGALLVLAVILLIAFSQGGRRRSRAKTQPGAQTGSSQPDAIRRRAEAVTITGLERLVPYREVVKMAWSR
jgi:hypothetical protein